MCACSDFINVTNHYHTWLQVKKEAVLHLVSLETMIL